MAQLTVEYTCLSFRGILIYGRLTAPDPSRRLYCTRMLALLLIVVVVGPTMAAVVLSMRRLLLAALVQRLRHTVAVVRAALLHCRDVRPRGQHVVLDLALVGAAQDTEKSVLAPPCAPRIGRDLSEI